MCNVVFWGFKAFSQKFLSEVSYDGQLSAPAYVILGIVLLIIIGGLSWCFYRAVKAGGEEAPVQHPDEVGNGRQ